MTKQDGTFARRALAAQSNERLVRLLREGHERAFEEMVRRYRGPLVAFATAIVNHDRAEDVVQTALEKAHRALLADDREINLQPWLFTIVRNGSLNLIRAEPSTDELDPWLSSTSPTDDPEQTAERNEEMDRLFTAICALPVAQREALVRRELEGVGHGEIAAQLGTTATAVRGLIFRARTQLRNAMGAAIPVPLLRGLLTQSSTAGIAGGGATAAFLGSAGAKGGAAVAAAVIALGAGIAVDRHHGDESGDADVALAQAADGKRGSRATGDGRSGSEPATSSARGSGPGSTAPQESRDRRGDGAGGSAGSGSDGGGQSDSSGSHGSGGPHSGTGSSGDGDDDSSGGEAPDAPEPEGDDGPEPDDHDWFDHDEPEPPEPPETPETPEPPEVDEPDDDPSGPGGDFDEHDDDRYEGDGT